VLVRFLTFPIGNPEITFCRKLRRRSRLERNDPPKSRPCAPDASAQTGQLHDLAVINRKVGMRTLVLDVIRKDFRISSFEP